jgi:hypothetical protein
MIRENGTVKLSFVLAAADQYGIALLSFNALEVSGVVPAKLRNLFITTWNYKY